jgi:hypothetical protein
MIPFMRYKNEMFIVLVHRAGTKKSICHASNLSGLTPKINLKKIKK